MRKYVSAIRLSYAFRPQVLYVNFSGDIRSALATLAAMSGAKDVAE
jgi:hypothetical protein